MGVRVGEWSARGGGEEGRGARAAVPVLPWWVAAGVRLLPREEVEVEVEVLVWTWFVGVA